MDYLDRYMKDSWEFNMYLSGRKNEVNWNIPTTWKIPEINKAVKYFNSIAETLEDEMVVFRGTTMPSPMMVEMSPEMPAPGKEKFSQVLATTYSLDIAHEFSKPKNKVVGYLHVLRLQPGVKYIDISKYNVGEQQDILLVPGYKLILQEVRPINYGYKHIKKWEYHWIVF